MKNALDLTADETGLIDVTVTVNGQVVTKTVDVYDANEFLAAKAGDANGLTTAAVRELAAEYFQGATLDWRTGQAVAFWKTVQKTLADLGKGESASGTPS